MICRYEWTERIDEEHDPSPILVENARIVREKLQE